MDVAAILLAVIVVLLLYLGNKYLRDLRAIRRELADGKSLREIDEMVRETREQLLTDYDEITTGLDRRIEKLEGIRQEAETMIGRLEKLLSSERLKTLEERGVLFAIEAGENTGTEEADRNRRIADLIMSGATIEEIARITESSVREVELVRLLLRRREEASGS